MQAYSSTYETNKRHQEKLLARAVDFCSKGDWANIHLLYRNKPWEYFLDITKNHNSIMKKYAKDNGGDPMCPLNGKLKGLFFCVTLVDGQLPISSPFGDSRVILPLAEVFDDFANLYFADFFCLRGCKKYHYVQVVLTKDGSEADRFCRENLIVLDPRDNGFLIKLGRDYVTINMQELFVEVFYTEDVDLTSRQITKTKLCGRQGRSTPGGIPKTAGCDICDVHVNFCDPSGENRTYG